MSGGKEKSSKGRIPASRYLACLHSIKPLPPTQRFLISWEANRKVLKFGCGHGEKAVLVSSNRKMEWSKLANAPAAKLPRECVWRFLEGKVHSNGGQLLNRCQALLRAYLHFRDQRLYSLLAVWSIATYVYVIFSHFGYLFFHSKFKRSAKTRSEEILSHICFDATLPLNGPTVPTIRDTAAEGHTVILDTLERWKDKNPESYSAAMEFLDAGFRNGGVVAKMVKSGPSDWRRETFPVYAPYVLAAINKESLADTALDRSFVIEIHRKPIEIKKQSYNFDSCEKKCSALRDEMYRWALENASAIADCYHSRELSRDVDTLQLNDRAADIWKPLLAVARVLGNAVVGQALASLAAEMGRDPDAAERERVRAIAHSLRRLVDGNRVAVGITSDFVQHLQRESLTVTEHELHGLLAQWGFEQSNVRLQKGPRRAWQLQDSRLEEIERENIPLVCPSKNVTTVTTSKGKP